MVTYLFVSLLLTSTLYAIVDFGSFRLYKNGWVDFSLAINGANFIACFVASIVPLFRWITIPMIIYCLVWKREG